MIYTFFILITIAGVAEHFKDLSSGGKLKGYWDKNHEPMYWACGWHRTQTFTNPLRDRAESLWWKVHLLQGPRWRWIPVGIRQYISFRDGWHLLKFISVNTWALAIGILIHQLVSATGASFNWCGYDMPAWIYFYLGTRLCFSLPETVLRILIKHK